MAKIDEDGNVVEEQQNLQQQEGGDGQQQEQQQEIPLSQDRVPTSLDKSLDAFIKDSTRGPVGKTNEGESPKLGADGKPVPANKQGQQQQQQANPNGQGANPNQQVRTVPQGTAAVRQFGQHYFRNAQSDIVDSRTGKVIAKAGSGYAAFSAIYPELAKAEQEVEKMRGTIAAIEKSQQVAVQAGLTIEEAAMGTRIMAAYKKDPVATIKYLLNEAQTSGKDVSSIAQGGVDPSVLRSSMQEIIAEAIKPFQFLVQQQEQQTQSQQAMEESRNTVNEFVEQFPDATVQDKEIGALMTSQGLTLKEAYFALKAHAFENKYDWTKPLGPQIGARRAQQNGGGRVAPNGGGANRSLPTMNGRAGNQQQVKTDSRVAGVEEGYGDIVKGIFEELGLQQ